MVRRPIVPEFTGEEYLRWESARPEKYISHFGFIVSFAGGTLRDRQLALAMRDVFKNKFSSCATFALGLKTPIERNAYSYPDDDRVGMGGAFRTTCYDDEIFGPTHTA